MKEVNRQKVKKIDQMRKEFAELYHRQEALSGELYKTVMETYKPLIGTIWQNRKNGNVVIVKYIDIDNIGWKGFVIDGASYIPVIIWKDDKASPIAVSNLSKSYKRVV